MKFFDRVAVSTATTGTGTVTLGTVLDTNFFTFAEQGAADADQVYYMLNEGGDVEIGIGTIGGTVTTLSRDTVLSSRISGTASTSKMNLAGGAQVRCISPAQAQAPLDLFTGVSDAAGAVTALNIGKYQEKSSGFTAVKADLGSTFRVTAAVTCALTAAATLGLSWWCEIKADGGNVTIDPDGSETINGGATYTVYNGTTAKIACDGSNFQVISQTSFWEPIGVKTVSGGAITFTGLSPYRHIKATIFATVTTDDEVLLAQTSVGGTFATSAGGYVSQLLQGFAASANGAANTGMRLSSSIGNAGSEAVYAEVLIGEFNQGSYCYYQSNFYCLGGDNSIPIVGRMGGHRVDTNARDGVKFLSNGGLTGGYALLEGIRS